MVHVTLPSIMLTPGTAEHQQAQLRELHGPQYPTQANAGTQVVRVPGSSGAKLREGTGGRTGADGAVWRD